VGAGIPVTKTAEADVAPAEETVVNATCGTVIAVEMTIVELEDGMMDPDKVPVVSVHGTTMVVKTETVVTGTVVTDAAAVVEMLDAQVMIAGLDGMYGAQIPWK